MNICFPLPQMQWTNTAIGFEQKNDDNGIAGTIFCTGRYSVLYDLCPGGRKFTAICQYPELPTGCEVTALAMVLGFYGQDVDKCELSDKYLDKGKIGETDFRTAFPGDPHSIHGFGCYAPAVVNCANRFLIARKSLLRAAEIKGRKLSDLMQYCQRGVPVLIWCTIGLRPGCYTKVWRINGECLRWYAPEHCVVLLGEKDGKAVIADPRTGEIVFCDKDLLEKRYDELFRQAAVIF